MDGPPAASAPPQQALLANAVWAHRATRRALLSAVVLCAVVQLLIDSSGENSASVFLILLTSLPVFLITLNPAIFRAAPLPSLATLGFNVATQSGALIFQTAYLKPVAFNLETPVLTFGACALFQGSLVAALLILVTHSTLRTLSRSINQRLYQPLGLMSAPTEIQLWIIGFLGCAAMVWTSFAAHGQQIVYGDIVGKLLSASGFIAYAPFLIPMLPSMFPGDRRFHAENRTTGVWALIAYFVVLIVIAIAVNSRTAFALGLASLGITALLYYLLGQLIVPRTIRRWLVAITLLLILIAPALSDLAIAMVVARSERATASPVELIYRTIDNFNDAQLLEEVRSLQGAVARFRNYEEVYLDDPFLNRLVVTKYIDNTMAATEVRTGNHQEFVWEITLSKLEALLPTPLLRFFDSDLDKSDLEFSIGDAIHYAVYGYGLGGRKLGSPVGHGLALMGWYSFLVAIPLFLIAFTVAQTLTFATAGATLASPITLFQAMGIFHLACLDSLIDPLEFSFRTLPQQLFIYWVLFHATAWIGRAIRPEHVIGKRGSI